MSSCTWLQVLIYKCMSLPNNIKIFQTNKKLNMDKNLAKKFVLGRFPEDQSKSCPSCMWYSYLTWYLSLPIIIKLSQTVWELWPAEDFGFRGNKYMKKVRVVFLALNTPTILIFASTKYYQNMSNHLEVMESTRIWLRNSFMGDN